MAIQHIYYKTIPAVFINTSLLLSLKHLSSCYYYFLYVHCDIHLICIFAIFITPQQVLFILLFSLHVIYRFVKQCYEILKNTTNVRKYYVCVLLREKERVSSRERLGEEEEHYILYESDKYYHCVMALCYVTPFVPKYFVYQSMAA